MLRLSGPPSVVERVALAALAAAPGVRAGADGLFRREEEPPRPAGTVSAAPVALVLRSLPPHAPILAIGAAATAGGRAGLRVSTLVLPARPVPAATLLGAGMEPGRLAGARPLSEVLARLAPEIGGAPILLFRPGPELEILRTALREAGRDEEPGPAVAVAPALRRADLLPPRGGLADAAAALGVPVPESEEPGDHAVALAAVWLRARERGVSFEPAPPSPGFDFDGVGFGPERLDELPERPGVYRFFDREGELLYVGKAADLRTRVRTYFARRTNRRRRHGELMEHLWRIEWEETGSELRALLLETREIRERNPRYNVQTEVRRSRPVAGDLVLFLPGSAEGKVELLFLRGGHPAGRIEVDRAKPAAARIRRALRTALAPEAPPAEDPAAAQIVTTWLRARGDGVNALDLSAAGSMADAGRKIVECLADPELFTAKFFR